MDFSFCINFSFIIIKFNMLFLSLDITRSSIVFFSSQLQTLMDNSVAAANFVT